MQLGVIPTHYVYIFRRKKPEYQEKTRHFWQTHSWQAFHSVSRVESDVRVRDLRALAPVIARHRAHIVLVAFIFTCASVMLVVGQWTKEYFMVAPEWSFSIAWCVPRCWLQVKNSATGCNLSGSVLEHA